jgi:SAM-dependent methyltransferase
MPTNRRPVTRLSRDDVIAGYRRVLGREPESEEVVDRHVAAHRDLWSFVVALIESDEVGRHQFEHAAARFIADQDSRRIEADAPPGATTLLLRRIEAAWSKFGEDEPYWSVLTDDLFRADGIDHATIEDFYGTGAEEVEAFEAACVRNSLPNTRQATVLDLGCGVGRVGEHFARSYDGYIGVDISESHLELARRRFAALGLTNARVMLLGDFLAAKPAFDVFFSVLSLQHSPPPVMLHLLEVCLARLHPGGYAFFQLPCYLYNYEFRLSEYLNHASAAAEGPEAMEMHALPQARVFRALAEAGLVTVEVLPYPRIGPIGFSYVFVARKPR